MVKSVSFACASDVRGHSRVTVIWDSPHPPPLSHGPRLKERRACGDREGGGREVRVDGDVREVRLWVCPGCCHCCSCSSVARHASQAPSGQTPYRDASGCGMDRALTGLVHCALGTDVGACGVSPSLERGTGHIAGHHRAAALVCRINRACHKEYMYTHGPSCFHVKQGVAPRRVAKLQDCLSTSKGWLWVHVRGRCFSLDPSTRALIVST